MDINKFCEDARGLRTIPARPLERNLQQDIGLNSCFVVMRLAS